MKKIIPLLLLSALIFTFTGCAAAEDGEFPVKLAGYTFSEKTDSIVCLSDSIADILIACGYTDLITARSDECTQPEIASLPTVGSKDSPSAQKVLDANPDVVFCDTSLPDNVYSKLDGLTIVLTMVPASNSEDLISLYGNICALCEGNTTGRKTGEEKARSILITMDDLQRVIPESKIVTTACYLYDIDGTAASGSGYDCKLFDYAKAVNVCAASKTKEDSLEKIRVSNPDYIFCAVGLKDRILSDPNFRNVEAVRNDDVYEIDSLMMKRQGNSLTQVLSFMIESMYPSLTKTSVPESSAESSDTASGSENSEESSIQPQVSADDSLTITEGMSYGYGQQGNDIFKIQQRLKDLGYFNDDPTGYFGEQSVNSFVAFEAANNLPADGTASAEDLRLLFSGDVKPAPAAESEAEHAE